MKAIVIASITVFVAALFFATIFSTNKDARCNSDYCIDSGTWK